MKKRIYATAIASVFTASLFAYSNASNYQEHAKDIPDWRKTGTPEEQLEALVKITPGTHHWMTEIAYRYQSLYWAAKQGKWDFADYQISSLEKATKRVGIARTKRSVTMNEFRKNVFGDLKAAAKKRDFEHFYPAFAKTGAACMSCHVQEGFPYITVPAIPPKPNNIVLGYPEE